MTITTLADKQKRVIGENVRRFREASGRSVIELAGEVDTTRGYWYEIEKGVANVTIEMLSEVARALGVTVQDLVEPKRKRA